MKNIALFGADGFIGRNIYYWLEDKYNFVKPSHGKLNLLDTKKVNKFFKNKHFDVVINCVRIGGLREEKDNHEILINNLKVFFNLTTNEEHFDKLINIGSGAEYGKQQAIINVRENFSRKPDDFYGLAKYIIGQYIENHTDKIVNLRCFGIWGIGEGENRFITNAIKKVIRKTPCEVIKNAEFSYCYINDLVKIIDWFIINKSIYKTYNVGGVQIDLLTIARKILALSNLNNKKFVILNAQKEGDYTCNDLRLRKELKFKFSDFDKNLSEVYKWYEENKMCYPRNW